MEPPILCVVTIGDRKTTCFVDLGALADIPVGLVIHVGDRFVPILSCRDWFGDERRDELTAQAIREIAAQAGVA